MSGVTTSSLSLAWSLRNWVILDYEEANGLTIRPWAPFLLSFILLFFYVYVYSRNYHQIRFHKDNLRHHPRFPLNGLYIYNLMDRIGSWMNCSTKSQYSITAFTQLIIDSTAVDKYPRIDRQLTGIHSSLIFVCLLLVNFCLFLSLQILGRQTAGQRIL